MKQLVELSATESHEFQSINGCLQWETKGLLYPFQIVVKMLQRKQGQARVRDLLKANDVIIEIKQHEDFTLTYRVLDLTSPADQDSKTVKVYSQTGIGIFIGEKPHVSGN